VSDVLTATFAVSVLAGMVRIGTPLLFGALGELVTERAAIMNLGLEGAMLNGAFAGFLVAHTTGSLWLGVGAAVVAGGVTGLLMAFLTSTLKLDQVISGLAINLLASGTTFYLYRVVFENVGSANLPNVATFPPVSIPLLSQIPVLGEVLFQQRALTYIGLATVPVIWFFLYRTKHGLEIRLIGENPRAADMRGVSVAWRQYSAVVFGTMMAGVGGAFLTLASAGLFLPNISGGRGYIAFALVIFGRWSPWWILSGAMFFGLIEALQLQLQAVGVDLPYQLLNALPYVLTIAALVTVRGRTRMPRALGIPYIRGA